MTAVVEEQEEDLEYARREEQRRANVKKLRRRGSAREWVQILVSAGVALAWWFWPSQWPFYILAAWIVLAHHDTYCRLSAMELRLATMQDRSDALALERLRVMARAFREVHKRLDALQGSEYKSHLMAVIDRYSEIETDYPLFGPHTEQVIDAG